MVRADSSAMPLRGVDAIATDVPYGRASSTAGVPTRRVVDRLMESARPLLQPDSRIVIMHPDTVPIEPGAASTAGFAVEGEHQIYIHRKLTRAITVLRRSSE